MQAIPGAGLTIPVWILGSSLFGAELAASLGLPYAFASHFAPTLLMPAVELYRKQFRPSEGLERPYVMLGVNVFAADTDAQARTLFTSVEQAFLNLRYGKPGRLPPPVEGLESRLAPHERAMLEQALLCSAVGRAQSVREWLESFVRQTGADELMVTSHIFDHRARVRSFEILAEVCQGAQVR